MKEKKKEAIYFAILLLLAPVTCMIGFLVSIYSFVHTKCTGDFVLIFVFLLLAVLFGWSNAGTWRDYKSEK